MTIPVTAFKSHCLEILRSLEKNHQAIDITRRGKVIARIVPAPGEKVLSPIERVRAQLAGTRLLASPSESVLHDKDFNALR